MYKLFIVEDDDGLSVKPAEFFRMVCVPGFSNIIFCCLRVALEGLCRE